MIFNQYKRYQKYEYIFQKTKILAGYYHIYWPEPGIYPAGFVYEIALVADMEPHASL